MYDTGMISEEMVISLEAITLPRALNVSKAVPGLRPVKTRRSSVSVRFKAMLVFDEAIACITGWVDGSRIVLLEESVRETTETTEIKELRWEEGSI